MVVFGIAVNVSCCRKAFSAISRAIYLKALRGNVFGIFFIPPCFDAELPKSAAVQAIMEEMYDYCMVICFSSGRGVISSETHNETELGVKNVRNDHNLYKPFPLPVLTGLLGPPAPQHAKSVHKPTLYGPFCFLPADKARAIQER